MTNKSIFVACDVSSQKEILDLLTQIHDDISGLKLDFNILLKDPLKK